MTVRNIVCAAAGLLAGFHPLSRAQSVALPWSRMDLAWFSVASTPPDTSLRPAIAADVREATFIIREAFGRAFTRSCTVYVFPSRASLDHQWQQDWGDSSFHSDCWMVASGVASRLDILSPRVWHTEACEHNPDDSTAVRALITHEMVHVFHGQCIPSPDFAGLDSLSWFVEGVATYISGQLTGETTRKVRQFLAEGKGPKRLSDVWTGEARYGNAGTLVRFIDQTYGRETVVRLLGMTDQREMLRLLDTDESSLLRKWEESIEKLH